MTYTCRGCYEPKPEKEVLTRFSVYGKERVQFKVCGECRRLASKVYRQKSKEKVA